MNRFVSKLTVALISAVFLAGFVVEASAQTAKAGRDMRGVGHTRGYHLEKSRGLGRLGRSRIAAAAAGGLLVGAFVSFFFQPALSAHFSPKPAVGHQPRTST